MSEATIIIGNLPSYFEPVVHAELQQREIAFPKSSARGEDSMINIFNLASVALFTDHVEKLENIESGRGCDESNFLNFPWWQATIWVPADFKPTREPIDVDGWPLFIGSALGLHSDLAVLQKLDPTSEFGKTPLGYEKMRVDCREFLRSGFSVSEEKAVLQWVWLGLFDAASQATADNTFMALNTS